MKDGTTSWSVMATDEDNRVATGNSGEGWTPCSRPVPWFDLDGQPRPQL